MEHFQAILVRYLSGITEIFVAIVLFVVETNAVNLIMRVTVT